MTIEEAREEVRRIQEASGDAEIAHEMEDDLRHRVLAVIASGQCSDPAGLAAMALTTSSIKFNRWGA